MTYYDSNVCSLIKIIVYKSNCILLCELNKENKNVARNIPYRIKERQARIQRDIVGM